MKNYPHPLGADRRRGPFRAGERVQLTDAKGRRYTTMLTVNGYFQSRRGSFHHRDLIGKPEGTVLETESGHRLQALRPLVADYVLSMPRGATPVYPKDAAQIIQQADVFPGAHVIEAGVGSGGLTLSLLAAIGSAGHLTSVERRPEFAEIARANVESWYGPADLPWDLQVGDLADVLESTEPGSVDHVILDMLDPWEHVAAACRALRPGGVFVSYITTTPQLSRVVEAMRASGELSEPESFESLIRTWHVEGLAVRPNHSMVGHTGFLVIARRIAPGSEPLMPTRRPAPAAQKALEQATTDAAESWASGTDQWSAADLPQRTISERKLRKVRRAVAHRADVEQTGSDLPGKNLEQLNARMENE